MPMVGSGGSGGRRGQGRGFGRRFGGCYGSGGAPGGHEYGNRGRKGGQDRRWGRGKEIPHRGPELRSGGRPYIFDNGNVAKHWELTAEQKRAKNWQSKMRYAGKMGRTAENAREWSQQEKLDRLARRGKLDQGDWDALIPTVRILKRQVPFVPTAPVLREPDPLIPVAPGEMDWEPLMPTVRVDDCSEEPQAEEAAGTSAQVVEPAALPLLIPKKERVPPRCRLVPKEDCSNVEVIDLD